MKRGEPEPDPWALEKMVLFTLLLILLALYAE
jgi:hypothetical protein